MSIPLIIAIVVFLIIIISAYTSANSEFQTFLLEKGANANIYKKAKRNGIIIFSVSFLSIACFVGIYFFYVRSVNMTSTEQNMDIEEEFAEQSEVFYDVESTWAEEAVMYLANEGIVSGTGNNMFGAENNITRAEFVTMLVRMLENKMEVNIDTTYADGFNDVLADKYYSQYLIKAKALGIASGYEGNVFKPDNTISRQDMFTFTERALNMLEKIDDNSEFDIYSFYVDASLISNYAVPSIRNLTAVGIISGSNNMIRPLDLARRNEAAQMLYGIINNPIINNETVYNDVPEDYGINIPEGAFEWAGNYYMCFDNATTWSEAEIFCEGMGGHLAVISSDDENDAIFLYMKSQGYDNAYFGLTDRDEEGLWEWINGEPTVYQNWHSGEPNGENSNEDYAMYYYKFDDGTWNDGDFGENTVNGGTVFICEWNF